jgi:hypothetical protein
LVPMRMRIFVRRRAMGGPTGVAKADDAGKGFAVEQGPEAVIDLAGAFPDFQFAVAENRQPGAIVAAVFQPAQPIEQDWGGLLFPDIANNSTHIMFIDEMRAKAK